MVQKDSSENIRRIGLMLHPSQGYMRDVLTGVYKFLRQAPHWQLVTDGFRPFLSMNQLALFDGDGVLACAPTAQIAELMMRLDVPHVNVSSRTVQRTGHGAVTDGYALGRLAAEHLLRCGLQSFAVVVPQWSVDEERWRGFIDTVEEAGGSAKPLYIALHEMTDNIESVLGYEVDLNQWAKLFEDLHLPIGIFALNPGIGCAILEACRGVGLRVPDQVAVVCVSDDILICEGATPPLSAVIQPSEQIGYRAASMLDQLMDGQEVDPPIDFLQPLGVTARLSTDLMATEDPDVAMALRLIRDDRDGLMTVADLLEHVPVSRKSLEMKFRRTLGRAPGEEIRRRRVDRAKALLIDTDLQITDVCFRSGFNSRQVFSTAFRKATGKTPRQWRSDHRGLKENRHS